MTRSFDWKNYETVLTACLVRSIRKTMQEYPDERFYGAALHSFYSELGDFISLPLLSVNTEEELEGQEDLRWSAPDWYWNELEYENKTLERIHNKLCEVATRSSESDWEKLHRRWMGSLVKVAKRVTSELKSKPQATRDFGFFLFDEESGEDMANTLRRCMTAAKFKRLFPDLQKSVQIQKVTSKSGTTRTNASGNQLVNDTELTDADIAKLRTGGTKSIPKLVEFVKSTDSPKAVALLGQIGIPDPRAIDQLKRLVQTSGKKSLNAATSLAMLGELDFLVGLALKKTNLSGVVEGVKKLYSAHSIDQSAVYVPLDYRPIERLLEIPSCRKLAQKPASDTRFVLETRSIRASDFDEAVRGTKSTHRMIREHAVLCLGNPKLGKKLSGEAMHAISSCFSDRSSAVRYRALISMQRWKAAAKNYIPAIKKIAKRDPDDHLRYSADCVLAEFRRKGIQ